MKIISAVLLNEEIINFGDFNVFIGGNGVGKTTLISELFHKVADMGKSQYFWINSLNYGSDDVQADMDLIKSSLGETQDGSTVYYFSNASKDLHGNVDQDQRIRFYEGDLDRMSALDDPNIFNEMKFRRPFASFSSCEIRLQIPHDVEITRLNQPPQDPINVLYRNKALLNEIDTKIFEIFKYHFIILSHSNRNLEVGISRSVAPIFDYNHQSLPEEYRRLEQWKNENFIPIIEAGHGIRSMIRLLTSLLEPVNQIILIDEPEVHLYPSQKRWLGKQLVRLAVEQHKQVFVVTHDPMILQGIFDARTSTAAFRVDRDADDQGIINHCIFETGEVTFSGNQDQYLQGLFYQRSIVVEGASDRSFFQEMLSDYPETSDKDLGIISTAGTGNSKIVAKIMKKVGANTAFIYDLDVLLECRDEIRQIYHILGKENDPFENFERYLNTDVAFQAANINQKISRSKVITGYSSRTGFSDEWKAQNQNLLDEMFNDLKSVGIFITPNGTLESWAPDVEEKVRFPEEAPALVRANELLKRNLDNFLQEVLEFLDITVAIH